MTLEFTHESYVNPPCVTVEPVLKTSKEVLRIAREILNISAKAKLNTEWVKSKIAILQKIANLSNIQDYPVYKGDYPKDTIYLGRFFKICESGLELNFCELYAVKVENMIMLTVKYSYKNYDEDGIFLHYIESLSESNFRNLPDEILCAYQRYSIMNS